MTNELTCHQAGIVKALVGKYKNHDIAALFGVNSRAVSHVKNGVCYANVPPNYGHGLQARDIITPKIELINELHKLKNSG